MKPKTRLGAMGHSPLSVVKTTQPFENADFSGLLAKIGQGTLEVHLALLRSLLSYFQS
jgi:hypothetical protein